MDQPLPGQTVLVTGAPRAIGEAIVQRLASEGSRPIAHPCQDDHSIELPLPMLARTADTPKQRGPEKDLLHGEVLSRDGWKPALAVSQ